MEENMGLLKDVNGDLIPITYEMKNNNYLHDHIKPQPIRKSLFHIQQDQNYLSQYYKSIDRIGLPNMTYVVNVIKPICCTIKSTLKIKSYVKWNQDGFESLKDYLLKE